MRIFPNKNKTYFIHLEQICFIVTDIVAYPAPYCMSMDFSRFWSYLTWCIIIEHTSFELFVTASLCPISVPGQFIAIYCLRILVCEIYPLLICYLLQFLIE